jgi:hypothetical protein
MAAEPTDKPAQRTTGVFVLFDTRQSETPRTRRQRRRVNRHGLILRTAHAIATANSAGSSAAEELRHSIAGAAMPWKCPACQTQIAHNGDAPEPRRVYRCHVCRLELTLDETTHKLTVTAVIRRVTDSEP